MDCVLTNINLLDADQRTKFRGRAHRIMAARKWCHRSYHEHPVQQDLFAEAEAIAAWNIVTCCYSGIEQAMKCLLKMQGTFIDKHPREGGHRHHDIGKLFKVLAYEEQEILRVSYVTYRSLHNYIPPETVDCFLDGIDEGYQAWRYFLLDGRQPEEWPKTHPGAMLEIWSALSDIICARVFRNHGLHTVKRRIEFYLEKKTKHDVWIKHINTGIGKCEIKDMNRWFHSHDNIKINAFADLFYCHGNNKLDRVNVLASTMQVLRSMVDIVQQRKNDNDFTYFLHRAQTSRIVWNPNDNCFETASR